MIWPVSFSLNAYPENVSLSLFCNSWLLFPFVIINSLLLFVSFPICHLFVSSLFPSCILFSYACLHPIVVNGVETASSENGISSIDVVIMWGGRGFCKENREGLRVEANKFKSMEEVRNGKEMEDVRYRMSIF